MRIVDPVLDGLLTRITERQMQTERLFQSLCRASVNALLAIGSSVPSDDPAYSKLREAIGVLVALGESIDAESR